MGALGDRQAAEAKGPVALCPGKLAELGCLTRTLTGSWRCGPGGCRHALPGARRGPSEHRTGSMGHSDDPSLGLDTERGRFTPSPLSVAAAAY